LSKKKRPSAEKQVEKERSKELDRKRKQKEFLKENIL
jgi:hypothetical protein